MTDPRIDPVGTVRVDKVSGDEVCRIQEGDESGKGQHVWWRRTVMGWRVYHHNEVAPCRIKTVGTGKVDHPEGDDCWCKPDNIPVEHSDGTMYWIVAHHMPLQTEAQLAERAAKIFEGIADLKTEIHDG